MTIDRRNTILSVVLGIIIIILAVVLVRSIILPYQQVEERQEMTQHVRARMLNIRDALIQYEQQFDTFPPSESGLDSLVAYIRSDSMQAVADSLFYTDEWGLVQDSLIYSPRPPHQRFEYAMTDTLIRAIYVLKDPGSDDQIGSLTNPTLINTPNW